MTYRELKAILNQLNEDQLDFDATVLFEYPDVPQCYPVQCFDSVASYDEIADMLDEGHPILVI